MTGGFASHRGADTMNGSLSHFNANGNRRQALKA